MSKPTKQAAAIAVAEPVAPAPQLPAAHSDRAISGWLSTDEILRRKEMIATVYKSVMKPDEHYGASFPGDKKKNLLKPGADVLLMTFQLYPDVEVEERNFDGDHREYRITAYIKRISDGLVVAVGVGTCTTKETKYRYRKGQRKCPTCEQPAIIKTNGGRNPGGYWCVPDKGGCGANFNPGDPQIEGQDVGKIENPDPADCWNTCLKIGKKRAVVDGTITATGCSDLFTQDIEDLSAKIDAEEARPSRSTAARTEQLRQDAAAREASAKPAAPAVQPAAAAPSPAAAAVAAQVNDAAQLGEQLGAAYKGMQELAGPKTAAKFWKHWGKDNQRPERLDAMRRANEALRAIINRLGPRSPALDQILGDILQDRENPDDVPGILADLERAAGSAPAAAPQPAAVAGEDQPPY